MHLFPHSGVIREEVLTWPKADKNHLIVTSAQMKEFEEKIFSKGMPVEALMEKVGLGMRDWILEKPELLNSGVVFLVGPGHNGGDGLVLARELYLAGVEVSLWCPFQNKKELTKKHLAYCNWIGIQQLQKAPDVMKNNLWIDALFGIGQTRPIPNNIQHLLDSREQKQPGKLISLDVPTGICSDTGRPICNYVATASFTLTVGLFKQGLLQDIALPYVGKLVRIDIGLSQHFLNAESKGFPLKLAPMDILSLPFPRLKSNLNKYQRGRVLILAGSEQYRGAAILALQGAMASGVGAINTVIPEVVADSLLQVTPEVVVSGFIKTCPKGKTLLGSSLGLQKLDQFDSLLIGPGLGLSDEKWYESENLLADFKGLLVLDADGINRLAQADQGWQWLLKRKGPTWITPHKKEFDRLFPELINMDPFEASSLAAHKSRTVILLKGAHSLIADESGAKWQLTETSSFSARIGLGDVLAGFVAGLGAMSFSGDKNLGSNSLAIGAFLHALAAKNCSYGTSASLIANFLGELVKDLQSGKCLQRHI